MAAAPFGQSGYQRAFSDPLAGTAALPGFSADVFGLGICVVGEQGTRYPCPQQTSVLLRQSPGSRDVVQGGLVQSILKTSGDCAVKGGIDIDTGQRGVGHFRDSPRLCGGSEVGRRGGIDIRRSFGLPLA